MHYSLFSRGIAALVVTSLATAACSTLNTNKERGAVIGSADYNQGLSERRARSTANYLVGQGVSLTRLQTAGRGETEPVASNDSDTGMQKNRRVEVAIYASDAYRNQLRSQYKSGL